MNNIKLLKHLLLVIVMINSTFVCSQSNTSQLISENQDTFVNSLLASKKSEALTLTFQDQISLNLKLNIHVQKNESQTFIGTVNQQKLSSFTITKDKNTLEGTIILKGLKQAFKIFTDVDNKVYLKETDIHDVLCIDFEDVTNTEEEKSGATFSKMPPQLESLPGAPGIIYLDFDGEVVSGTSWLGGATINAQSPNFSDQKITEIWKIMAEDFRPFNLNITTRRDLFDAAPKNRRMMCIFTPTTDAAPGSGGVAYLWSFRANNDNPCWVYNLSTRAAGETGSHEVGHTLGLSHDGVPGTTYYAGHGQWSPIMGWSASKPIGHWSKGEYTNANQTQDDIAIIAGTSNNVGFQDDDHGDVITEATPIVVETNGNVSSTQNSGLISMSSDKDIFSFVAETGNVSFSFNPDPDYPNLNIQARLLNALGEEVEISDPAGLNASFDLNLTGGTYFIEIDGVGEGTLANGYSDYSSLGNYFISGNYTPGNNNQPPVSNFEAQTDCSTVAFTSTTINNVDTYLWNFGDGVTSNEQNPTHQYNASGVFTVSLTTSNTAGQNTNEKVDFITINLPGQPIAEDQNICTGESASITMSGSNEYQWYDSPTGGNLLATGATYQTPELNQTQTYYVTGAIGNCLTTSRTAVQAIVSENPAQPVVSINSDQNLSIDTQHASYQWYLDGIAITDANQSEYLPEDVGDYTIEVFNEVGCNSVSEVFNIDLSQLNLSQGTSVFRYYPNPNNDDNILHIDGLTVNQHTLRIVNSYGQIILETTPNSEMDVSALSQGLYMVLINNKPIGKYIKR
ncbi:PKD domain-containing protein [Aquimarina sp. 2201CG5-10]|uniref:Ig-like domain-containing protein n=1 Tax=Aquimarina callyspongiae TaxID=3098150 RepID=UPI002AB407FC|nr:PKD domain-containing protein [Aquimarina sp. 2201CG5-10]MDY8135486.1 PKD domain-containing protein [Aquimarina sp. 2201CG5-10]